MRMITLPTQSLMEMILLQLEKGGKANLTVTGSSMLPMLQENRDSVILSPLAGELRPGDVALYQSAEGGYILHRVIRIREKEYLFCGDNQAYLETVPKNKVLAVVTEYVKFGKPHQLTEWNYRFYKILMVRFFGLRKYYIALRRRLGRFRRGA